MNPPGPEFPEDKPQPSKPLTAAERRHQEQRKISTYGTILVAIGAVVALVSAIAAVLSVAATHAAIADTQAARLEQNRVECTTSLLDAEAQTLGLLADWAAQVDDMDLHGPATDLIMREPEKEQALLKAVLATTRCAGQEIIPAESELGEGLGLRSTDMYWAFVGVRFYEPRPSTGDEKQCIIDALRAYTEVLGQATTYMSELRSGGEGTQGFVDDVEQLEPAKPDFEATADRCVPPADSSWTGG